MRDYPPMFSPSQRYVKCVSYIRSAYRPMFGVAGYTPPPSLPLPSYGKPIKRTTAFKCPKLVISLKLTVQNLSCSAV